MPRPRLLNWLLALLLCWQGLAVAATVTATSPVITSGKTLHGQHHATAAPADCAHHPEHCRQADDSGPHHCGQQCLHCPAPTAGQLATVLPAPGSPPDAVAARAPPRPGFEIYRPPAI